MPRHEIYNLLLRIASALIILPMFIVLVIIAIPVAIIEFYYIIKKELN